MKWWEKTVEYLFVIDSVKNNKMNLSPLDGNHELAGDLIASENSNFFLVEFKAKYSSIISEQEKFHNFYSAKRALKERDGHHFIIYGEQSQSSPGQLILQAQTYFSEVEIAVSDIYSQGINVELFKEYLEEYIDFKIPRGGASSGGNQLNFGMVAAVDSETGKANTISIDEFYLNLNLTKKQSKSMSLGM